MTAETQTNNLGIARFWQLSTKSICISKGRDVDKRRDRTATKVLEVLGHKTNMG